MDKSYNPHELDNLRFTLPSKNFQFQTTGNAGKGPRSSQNYPHSRKVPDGLQALGLKSVAGPKKSRLYATTTTSNRKTEFPPTRKIAFTRPSKNEDEFLQVEGNSVLSGLEYNQASTALKTLSACVATERQLKEELERAKKAKMEAFREVYRIHKQNSEPSSSDEAGVGVKKKDERSLAHCSVVCNTLASTVQCFVRSYYSKSLCFTLGRIARNTNTPADFTDTLNKSLLTCSEDRRSRTDADTILDEDEILHLKQLYFDYFDCETLSLHSPVDSEFVSRDLNSRNTNTSFSTFASTTM
ncbi:hypothetical protein ADEAN_000397100 [Angomonas deanei]|uniref:Uncharacterized protein n=1 Tax=Angomonas deanei TaxID=59799 RepID=A0A7G2CAC5_9TRYP|nr:hypothetical protein ADEAN_000397100 [Angomonas deanei]